MKERVRVEVPLIPSLKRNPIPTVIKVPPPCFYCGADVDETQEHLWVKEGKYEVKAWGYGRKFGTPMLVNCFAEGKQIIEKYRFEIPYCPEHIHGPKILKVINVGSIGLGVLSGLSFYISHLIDSGSFEWDSLWVLIGPLILFTSIFWLIGSGIQFVITKVNPKYKDYPLGSGRYGISIYNVTTHSGTGPITYSVRIGFSDPDAAHRFLKYNRARVTKGEELLVNKTD